MSACQHGHLARSCEICERDARIKALEDALRDASFQQIDGAPCWCSFGPTLLTEDASGPVEHGKRCLRNRKLLEPRE